MDTSPFNIKKQTLFLFNSLIGLLINIIASIKKRKRNFFQYILRNLFQPKYSFKIKHIKISNKKEKKNIKLNLKGNKQRHQQYRQKSPSLSFLRH